MREGATDRNGSDYHVHFWLKKNFLIVRYREPKSSVKIISNKQYGHDQETLIFNQERVGNHHPVFDFLTMLHVFRIQS